MEKGWESSLIKSWDNTISWNRQELSRLTDLLNSISENNNGQIYLDEKLPSHVYEEYKINRVKSILDSFVAEITRHFFVEVFEPVYSIKSNKFKTTLSFVQPMQHATRINLNSAKFEELESLPGLGKKTASRIIDYREKNGRIKRLTELKKIKSLRMNDIQKFSKRVSLLNPSDISINIKNAESMIKNPSFVSYINFVKVSNTYLTKFSKNPKSIKELIIGEIEGIKNKLEIEPNLHGYLPGIRSSRIKKLFAENKSAQNLIKIKGDNDIHGVFLRDSFYRHFTLKLLKESKKNIRLVMFFFTFEDEKKHATDKHMEEIINAKKRGVDIKIILDHQEEGDPKPTKLANKNAYEYLTKNKIPVTFDSEQRATHTKLLLIDDSHVVLGSHNWTGGSFFVYKDSSMYINSKKISDVYYSHFDNLWKEYHRRRK